jgi:5-methylcytosine-specific restriction endonuclease McrA
MGKRRKKIIQLDGQTRAKVIRRDKGRCVICGRVAHDIHEIVSRSKFGTRTMNICFSERNRVCLCRKHHMWVQGNPARTAQLLKTMQKKYGYTYPEAVFRRYL